ncbi:MAG: hypothetical protein CM15mP128_3250 [Methanobacteriota archaeon]|nr:MAG: hypothetical protein CM15mP128_3250 [Euryarchaeota archaeon]
MLPKHRRPSGRRVNDRPVEVLAPSNGFARCAPDNVGQLGVKQVAISAPGVLRGLLTVSHVCPDALGGDAGGWPSPPSGPATAPFLAQFRRVSRRARGLTVGFCTPGFLISAQALLDRLEPNRSPSQEAIEGNLCRAPVTNPSWSPSGGCGRCAARRALRPHRSSRRPHRRVPKNHNCPRAQGSFVRRYRQQPGGAGERFGKNGKGGPGKNPIHATRAGGFPPGQHPGS